MNDIELKRKLQALLPTESGCWDIKSPTGKLFTLVKSIPEPINGVRCNLKFYTNNNEIENG